MVTSFSVAILFTIYSVTHNSLLLTIQFSLLIEYKERKNHDYVKYKFQS